MNSSNVAHLPVPGNGPPVDEDRRREILATGLRGWLDEHPGSTIAQIAKSRIGFSDGAISSWMAGKYAANPKRVNDRVEQFLDRERTRDAAVMNPGIYRTRFFLDSLAKLAMADMLPGRMAVVTAPPGQGKTTLLRTYAERHLHAHYILCDTTWRSPHGFSRSLLGALTGKRGVRGRADELAREITRAIANAKPMPFIILDDAHDLAVESINVLVACCERAGASFAIAGHTELADKLRGLASNRAEWWARIKSRSIFSCMNAGDAHPVEEMEGIARMLLGEHATPDALALLTDSALCTNIRELTDACQLARLTAEERGVAVNDELVAAAVSFKQIPMRRKAVRR